MNLNKSDLLSASFDLSCCKLCFYVNGLVYLTFKTEAKYKLGDALELFELLKKKFNGKKFQILVDINNLQEANHEVRQFHERFEYQQYIACSAIVTKQPITRVLATVYLKIHKPLFPIRLFSNSKQAIDWLNIMRLDHSEIITNDFLWKNAPQFKKIETKSAVVCLRDDAVLEFRTYNINQTIIEAKENIHALREVAGKQSWPYLLNLQKIGNIDRNAREYYASGVSLTFASKIAIVVGSIYTRFMGTTVQLLFRSKSQLPIQLFQSEAQALAWLLEGKEKTTAKSISPMPFFSIKNSNRIYPYRNVKFSGLQIEELFQAFSRFAIGDFSYRIIKDGSHEVFNTLVSAVTMLGEEYEQASLSKNIFSQIINSAPAIFYKSSINSFYDFISIGKNIEILGFSADELVTTPTLWLDSIHPEDIDNLKKQIEECKDKEACELKYRIKNKAESQYWIKDKRKVIYNEQGTAFEVLGFWIDISEEERLKDQSESLFAIIDKTTVSLSDESGKNPVRKKNEEQENQHSEPNFIDSILALSKLHNFVDSLKIQAAVFSNTSESILITDKNGMIQLVNPSFEKITGFQRTEVIGQNPNILSSGKHDKIFYKTLWDSLLQSGHWQGEIINKRKDGEFYVQFTSISNIKNDQGEVVQYLSVANDITARVKAEEELRKININLEAATQAKSNFISNMSHEIRTPLNSIIGLSDLLNTPDLQTEQQEYLGRIIKSGQNLLELINNVLDLSKIESGAIELEYSEFDLNNLIKEIFGLFEMRAVQKGIKLKLNFTSNEMPFVKGDALRIRQILMNLIGNSIKFTDKGFCQIEVGPHILVGNKLQVRIAVIDTGIGIAADKLSLLFGRFSQMDASITRQYGGSGLGLSISRELVQLMKGEVRVKSELNVGSEFEIIIPLELVQQKTSDVEVVKNLVLVPDRELSILIVDDVEDNRLLIKAYLKKLPFQLDFATNGEEAISLYQVNSYDLILMDMQMPIMDGYTATENIRLLENSNKRPRVPIVALTGFALNIEKEKSLAAGCDMHMSKPIRKQELLNTIINLTSTNTNSGQIQIA